MLYNFFRFIEKSDTAFLKSKNNKLILNIVGNKISSFTHIELELDDIRGQIDTPLCITHEKLSIINKLSPKNPIIIYMQKNKIYLFTKTDKINIKWNLCQDDDEDNLEEPPQIDYKFGFIAPVGSLSNIAKMDNKIVFEIKNNKIKLKCGSLSVAIKEKCEEKFIIEFNTKDIINFLKNLPQRDNVKIYIKERYPLKMCYKNDYMKAECYFSCI